MSVSSSTSYFQKSRITSFSRGCCRREREFAIINDSVSHDPLSGSSFLKFLERLQKSLPLEPEKRRRIPQAERIYFRCRYTYIYLHRVYICVFSRRYLRERFRGKLSFFAVDNETTPHILKTLYSTQQNQTVALNSAVIC